MGFESQTHPQDDHVDRITDCSTQYGQAPAVCTRVRLAKGRCEFRDFTNLASILHVPLFISAKCKQFPFLARLLILIKKGGLLQLKFGVVGVSVGVNIYLWAR